MINPRSHKGNLFEMTGATNDLIVNYSWNSDAVAVMGLAVLTDHGYLPRQEFFEEATAVNPDVRPTILGLGFGVCTAVDIVKVRTPLLERDLYGHLSLGDPLDPKHDGGVMDRTISRFKNHPKSLINEALNPKAYKDISGLAVPILRIESSDKDLFMGAVGYSFLAVRQAYWRSVGANPVALGWRMGDVSSN